MPENIPIEAAENVAKQYDCNQVIILAWDGENTHVITYGNSLEESAQATAGGNRLKRALGWPETLCNTIPYRIRKMKETIKFLTEQLKTAQKGESYPS